MITNEEYIFWEAFQDARSLDVQLIYQHDAG
jgi:hypothetical protein